MTSSYVSMSDWAQEIGGLKYSFYKTRLLFRVNY